MARLTGLASVSRRAARKLSGLTVTLADVTVVAGMYLGNPGYSPQVQIPKWSNQMIMEGGCGCGETRYTLKEPALFTHACHCMDCQNASGSAFLINMFIDRRSLTITGEIATSDLPTASGAGREVSACAVCGGELWTRYHLAPANIVHLRAGTLDDTSQVLPAAHIFTRTKQPWFVLPDGVPAFEAMYAFDEVWPADSLKRRSAIIDAG